MKKLIIFAFVAVFVFSMTPVFAAGAKQVKSCDSFAGGCNFGFWDGNGDFTTYKPDSYHDVLTPSGVETEVFKGVIANDTGHAVIYDSDSGAPIPAGQTCYSFVTTNTTPDWQLTISASGNFTLTCHFSAN